MNYHLASASNPVSAGSAIQIFATGQGQASPGGVDGLIEPLTLPLPIPLLPVGVTIGGLPARGQFRCFSFWRWSIGQTGITVDQ